MHIYSVSDPEFRSYGKLLEGYDTAELLAAMERIPMPKEGTAYSPGIESLEDCAIFSELRDRAYGGMPIQLGMCWGWNTTLNCLEYHRDSEVNIGTKDFILLLAKLDEVEMGMLDTEKVKAGEGLPRPGRHRGRGVGDHAALRSVPHQRAQRLPRGGGAAEGHQHGQTRIRAEMRRGPVDDRPQQVAAGASELRPRAERRARRSER